MARLTGPPYLNARGEAMWPMALRLLVVFSFWGAVLAGAIAAGAPTKTAELTAAGLAGVTLTLMSLRKPKPREATGDEAAVASATPRERRSVS